MLGHLVVADHRADGQSDLGGRAGGCAWPEARCDPSQVTLGRRQQILALARALLSQQRIAANNQPLAGKLLGQVALVEQPQPQRALLAVSSWTASLRKHEIQSNTVGPTSSRMRTLVNVPGRRPAPPDRVCKAIARETVGFIWSIACTIQSAPKAA